MDELEEIRQRMVEVVVIVCTSQARPTNPDEDLTIYETDTERYLQWSGGRWVERMRES